MFNGHCHSVQTSCTRIFYKRKVTPLCRAFLDKLTDSQLVKKSPEFYGTQGSLPCLQEPATFLFPESDESCPCPPTSYFLKIRSHIILPSLSRSSKLSLAFRFTHQELKTVFFFFVIRARSICAGCTAACRLIVLALCCSNRSHFRRQMSPRPTRRERSKQRKVEVL